MRSVEVKLDSYRCLAAKRHNGVPPLVPTRNAVHGQVPHDSQCLREATTGTLVDGEVIAIDESGRASFNALQHTRPNAHNQFYAFDMLIHRGRDVLRFPLESAASVTNGGAEESAASRLALDAI